MSAACAADRSSSPPAGTVAERAFAPAQAPVDTVSPSTTTAASTTVETTTTTVEAPAVAVQPADRVTTVFPDPTCPEAGHAAVIDRDTQRAWLCGDGFRVHQFPITSALDQPDPRDYRVYGKSMHTTSRFGGRFTRLTHFVAFARGEHVGARVGFHAIPVMTNGELVQPIESVGTPEHHGDSSGCIRARPDDAVLIWDWLSVGDTVRVIS